MPRSAPDALEMPDQQRAEVDPRRQRGPPILRRIELRAPLPDKLVKALGLQQLIQLLIDVPALLPARRYRRSDRSRHHQRGRNGHEQVAHRRPFCFMVCTSVPTTGLAATGSSAKAAWERTAN